MALTFDDRWIWDFWLVRDGDDHHIFYLQAPTALGDPHLRHWHASIGHAVSTDLVDWTVLPDALATGEPGTWDDYSTWTGSIVAHERRWHLLYTGTCQAEGGRVQRIGRATSDDLIVWRRSEMPPIEAPATYEKLETGDWYDEAWRDPWVFRDPADGWFHAYVTARVPHGDRFDRGVIGHIRSSDMRTWEGLAPVTRPMGMGQMEVPQLVELENRWYLVYCSDVETQAPGRRAAVAGTGTFYLVGDSPYGPFEAIGDGTLEADPHGSAYAGKLHRTSAGDLVFISWNRSRENGDFLGTIGDPRHVDVGGDGRLTVMPA